MIHLNCWWCCNHRLNSALHNKHHQSVSPKPPFDLKGKIKLQLHTFLPMMSWKCMLTAWSTDCSASKVINPKPSQRPRVNQGSRGLWQHKMKNSIGLQQIEDPSRMSKRLLGFGWCRRLAEQHKSKTKAWGIEGNLSLYCAEKYLVKWTIMNCLRVKHEGWNGGTFDLRCNITQ